MHTFLSLLGPPLVDWLLCLVTFCCVLKRDVDAKFRPLWFFLGARLAYTVSLGPILLMAGHGIEPHLAYKVYLYGYWLGFATEAAISIFIIKGLFDLAMAPLDGIKDLGEIVFRWASAISVAITAAVMFVPHPSGIAYATRIFTELQRAQGALTLCLLLFVSFALRPLGLSYRSRPFGVILGLGVLATANLVSSGWLAYSHDVYSVIGTMKDMATSAALMLWMVYFILPDSKRSIVVLPTTSPYLQWNQVAQALGDPPGFVAIAGVPPELFAPAELEMLRLASLKMTTTEFPSFDHPKTA